MRRLLWLVFEVQYEKTYKKRKLFKLPFFMKLNVKTE